MDKQVAMEPSWAECWLHTFIHMYLLIHLPVSLSTCLADSVSIHMYILRTHTHIKCIRTSVYDPSILTPSLPLLHPSIHPCIHPSCSSGHPSLDPSKHTSMHAPVHMISTCDETHHLNSESPANYQLMAWHCLMRARGRLQR